MWIQVSAIIATIVACTVFNVWAREQRIINLQQMLVKMSAQLGALHDQLAALRLDAAEKAVHDLLTDMPKIEP